MDTLETTLVVVSGKQKAKIFKLADLGLEKLAVVEIEKKDYSDTEGHFETRAGNQLGSGPLFSGAPREENKEKNRREFSKRLSEKLNAIMNGMECAGIYLFAPDYMKGQLQEDFTTEINEKISEIFEGNFAKLKGAEIMEKIRDYESQKKASTMPIKEEAKKILDSGK